MNVPQELVDLIIDNLHDETTALKHCSLVCKSWLPTSRKYIFERLYFDCLYRTQNLEPSYNFFSESPHLIPYIRVLKISGDSYGLLPAAQLLPAFSDLLTHLTQVELCGLNFPNFPEELHYIPNIISSHQISSIDLRTCVFSPADVNSLLGQCTTVRHLRVASSTTWEGACIVQTDAPRSYLETLEIDGSVSSELHLLADWLLHPHGCVSVARLKTLRALNLPFADVFTLKKILEETCGSLEELEVKYDGALSMFWVVCVSDSWSSFQTTLVQSSLILAPIPIFALSASAARSRTARQRRGYGRCLPRCRPKTV